MPGTMPGARNMKMNREHPCSWELQSRGATQSMCDGAYGTVKLSRCSENTESEFLWHFTVYKTLSWTLSNLKQQILQVLQE